ncbi:MAG: trypsin-like serine protease, partial [Myxococcota bacterium]|nr:trypsin-like serine protease [Myxococcota bacterium]
MRLLLTFLLVVSAAGCAYDSSSDFAATSETTQSNAIVNGTRAPQNTFLSESQILSIVFLSDQSGDEFCTGTLIHPRVVLSAEHCIDDVTASSLFIGFGMMPADRRALLPVSVIYPHPTIDFTMIVLGVDATEIIPEITPIEMNRDPVAEGWVGRKVDASGYGETYDNSTTGRFFASVEVIDFDGETVI